MFNTGLSTILIGVTVIVLNILDSVTTALAFRQYPDRTLGGEGNPLMRRLMLKSRILAEVLKHSIVLAVVVIGIIGNQEVALRQISTMLGLVVINNSWVVTSRMITKRKVPTPFQRLRTVLQISRITSRYDYIIIIAIVWGLAYLINGIIWR